MVVSLHYEQIASVNIMLLILESIKQSTLNIIRVVLVVTIKAALLTSDER